MFLWFLFALSVGHCALGEFIVSSLLIAHCPKPIANLQKKDGKEEFVVKITKKFIFNTF